jgi:hypothetical protein
MQRTPQEIEQRETFRARMGAELRRLREESELSLQMVADVLGSEKRDRISKVERGITGIDLFDYLRLMWFYQEYDPQHPAVLLARRLLPIPAKKDVGFVSSVTAKADQPGKQ